MKWIAEFFSGAAYYKAAHRRAVHANTVLLKAIDDVCSGAVTLAELKDWHLRGINRKRK